MSPTVKKALHYCLFLLVLGVICGGLLALVNSFTSERIAAYQEELVQAELKAAFGEDSSFPTIAKPQETEKSINNIYQWIDAEGQLKAVVYKVTTTGYGGDVISIVAFDITNDSIVGFKVVSASAETRGNATEFDFGFIGDLSTGELSFNVMSGATVTSTAVGKGVEIAANHYNIHKATLSVKVGGDE